MQLAIFDGSRVHPGAEHRADRAPKLLARILRKCLAAFPLDEREIVLGEPLPIIRRKIRILNMAATRLHLFERILEEVVLEAEHHGRIHLDEAPVAVIGEARIARFPRQRLDGGVVEPEIEDRVHHPRHRGARARAHRDEEGALGIPEGAAGELAHACQRGVDLLFEVLRILAFMRVEISADLGRDGEAGRHGQAEIRHLREICALPSEEIAHIGFSFGLSVAEAVDPFRHEISRSWKMAAGFTPSDVLPLASAFFNGVAHLARGLDVFLPWRVDEAR